MQSGDRNRAEKEWMDAANRGGRFAPLYLSLGQLKLESGDPDSAIRYAQQALNLNPSNVEAHLVLGSAYGNKRDFARSVSELELYTKARPADPNGMQRLGQAYMGQERLRRRKPFSGSGCESQAATASALRIYLPEETGKVIQRLNQMIARPRRNFAKSQARFV
jgi:predicted Zn-dependent protease